nr:unnamed protein product [Digitaria exilis]
MGISSKWIKSLVGIRKQEKGHNAEKQQKGQNAESSETRNSADQSLHKRKHSLDAEGALAVEEIPVRSETLTNDNNTQTTSSSICPGSTSLDVYASQAEHASKEEVAATLIQSAFRAFLARRALRALKGIVLLQALIRGHAVRRQTEETLQCMQALRQAGSKQQKSTSLQGLEPDDDHWGSNWLDRWMAVRPWENRLLDSNTKESLTKHEGKKDEEAKSQITPKSKLSTSNTLGQSKKKGVKHKKSYSDVSCTSFARPENVLPSTSLGSSKQKAKVADEVFEEVSSQPTEVTYKVVRNPKDKLVQANTPAKKRLSLPNNGKYTVVSVGGETGKGPTRKNLMNMSDAKARADAPNQGGKQVLQAG